jgi:microcystin-dependent protein
MANVTASKTWVSGETVTPAGLNLTAAPTVVVADGEVTMAKLAAAVQQLLVPAGAVQAFAMNSAPAGWLAANGNEYAKTGDYAALFAAICTTYGETNGSGGAGTSHFRVPDLRGYFVRGSGINGDLTESGAFGAKQADALISHTHSGTTGNDSPDHTHTSTFATASSSAGGPAFVQGVVGTVAATTKTSSGASARHTHSFTSSSMSPTGATETRPKNIAMLYCIKF